MRENVVAIVQSLKLSEGKKRRIFTSKRGGGRQDSLHEKSSGGVVSTLQETLRLCIPNKIFFCL